MTKALPVLPLALLASSFGTPAANINYLPECHYRSVIEAPEFHRDAGALTVSYRDQDQLRIAMFRTNPDVHGWRRSARALTPSELNFLENKLRESDAIEFMVPYQPGQFVENPQVALADTTTSYGFACR